MNVKTLKKTITFNSLKMESSRQVRINFEYEEIKNQKLEFGDIAETETRECTNPDISSIESNKVSNVTKTELLATLSLDNQSQNPIGFNNFLKNLNSKKTLEENKRLNQEKELCKRIDFDENKISGFPGKKLKKKFQKKNSKKNVGKSLLKKRRKRKRNSESKCPKKKKIKKNMISIPSTDAYRAKFLNMMKDAGGKKKMSKSEKKELNKKMEKMKKIKRQTKPKDFMEDYEIGERIGKGATSIVRKIIRKSDGFCFAMKTFKSGRSWPTPSNEGHILDQLNHPNIVEFIRFYKTSKNTHLIIEFFDGVTLAEYIHKKGHLSDKETKIISKQLFNTIRYCHAKKISHRDIKPENVLINDNLEIKLIDFAFSAKLKSRKGEIKADCGTPNYMAPEVVSKKVCSPYKTDIWALGVLMLKMRSGKLPFSAKSKRNLIKLIKSGKINEKSLERCSEKMRNLVMKVLQNDPSKRPRAKEALKDPYFNKEDTEN